MGKHIPIRECIVCRTKGEKQNFIRIVKTNDAFFIDTTSKMQGRGAYVCRTCLSDPMFLKKKALNRAFREAVPDEIYSALTENSELV